MQQLEYEKIECFMVLGIVFTKVEEWHGLELWRDLKGREMIVGCLGGNSRDEDEPNGKVILVNGDHWLLADLLKAHKEKDQKP